MASTNEISFLIDNCQPTCLKTVKPSKFHLSLSHRHTVRIPLYRYSSWLCYRYLVPYLVAKSAPLCTRCVWEILYKFHDVPYLLFSFLPPRSPPVLSKSTLFPQWKIGIQLLVLPVRLCMHVVSTLLCKWKARDTSNPATRSSSVN